MLSGALLPFGIKSFPIGIIRAPKRIYTTLRLSIILSDYNRRTTMTTPHSHTNDHDLDTILKQSGKIEDFSQISDIFGKLSDPKRVQIFWILCHCEECVTDLAAMVNSSSPAVSHHLRILKECGLIKSRREGKEVCYKAADNALTKLLHNVTEEIIAVSCPDAEIHPHQKCSCGEHHAPEGTPASLAEEIHAFLSENLDRHITIESLSREFHVNPTTIKTVFRSAYGNSIAAHMKEHRMEKAAELLCTSDLSIAEISSAVGFVTQSKFTQAFKETYGILPSKYRETGN